MERISVNETAKRLGVHPSTIMQGLRNKSFPVGCAIKMDSGRFKYIIPKAAFENFLNGTLKKEEEDTEDDII